jgi:transcriptional regulator with XRE-family HTH domain
MKRPSQGNLRRLRALIERYNLKGEDIARRLGVSTRRVYGWLSVGQTNPIPTAKLQLLELLLQREELEPARGHLLFNQLPPPKKKHVRTAKKRRKVRKAK